MSNTLLLYSSGNTMTLITQKVTGASKVTIWFLPLLSLFFFLLPYFPFFGRLSILSSLLKDIAIILRAILMPAYDTYKAIEHRGSIYPERILSYWLAAGFLYVAKSILGFTISRNFFDLIFYIIVIGITTWNYVLAGVTYKAIIRPFISSLRNQALKQKKRV